MGTRGGGGEEGRDDGVGGFRDGGFFGSGEVGGLLGYVRGREEEGFFGDRVVGW